MKIKYVIIFSILSSIIFAQDVYPFFSDPANQLEFEKKRIYIKEFEEERQYISGGGDEFNPMWLFFNNAPMFKSTPIETSFYYEYTFEITKNGVLLNEIEFLQFIGLTELADNIIIDYQNKFVQFQNDVNIWQNNRYYYGEKQKSNPLIGIGFLSTITGLMILSTREVDNKLGGYMLLGGGIIGIGIGLIPHKIKHEYPKPIEPILKQHLTNDQIKAIAESHNRKVYKEVLENK